jgi:hypothetical protein
MAFRAPNLTGAFSVTDAIFSTMLVDDRLRLCPREMSASASSTIKLGVRLGWSRRYRGRIPQSSELLISCSRYAAFASTWFQVE